MDYERHGGECCGITHIYNFGNPLGYSTKNYVKSVILNTIEEREQEYYDNTERRLTSHVYEAVLTNDQLSANNYRIAKALKELGFKLVTRATNSNTGNVINIFHLNKGDGIISEFSTVWETL